MKQQLYSRLFSKQSLAVQNKDGREGWVQVRTLMLTSYWTLSSDINRCIFTGTVPYTGTISSKPLDL